MNEKQKHIIGICGAFDLLCLTKLLLSNENIASDIWLRSAVNAFFSYLLICLLLYAFCSRKWLVKWLPFGLIWFSDEFFPQLAKIPLNAKTAAAVIISIAAYFLIRKSQNAPYEGDLIRRKIPDDVAGKQNS